MKSIKVDIVVFDDEQEQVLEEFIERYSLSYANSYARAEDYIEYESVEMSQKLYTMLLLLENNWHIEKSVGAVGEQ